MPETTAEKKGQGRKLTSSNKKNPLFFQIREKYHVSPIGNDQYHHHNQAKTTSEAFDPWVSTSFSSSSYDSPPQFVTNDYSPTSAMEPISEMPLATKTIPTQKYKRDEERFERRDRSHKTINSTRSKSTSSNSTHRNNNHFHHNHGHYQPTPSPSRSQNIIPGITKMTMRQSLAVIFSAFWERADLYKDVLELDHDNPSKRQLRLAFFREGRKVLASPIESLDDVTVIDSGMKPDFAVSSCARSPTREQQPKVQSGMKVSRKAKMKFQAVNLAYDLLMDESKRKLYDEWRLWNTRLPPPSSLPTMTVVTKSKSSSSNTSPTNSIDEGSQYQRLSNHELNEVINAGCGVDDVKKMRSKKQVYSPPTTKKHINNMGSYSVGSNKKCLPSILKEPTFGTSMDSRSLFTNRGRNKLSQYSNNERKIKWNEEVEELVILDSSRECDLTNYDSFHSSVDGANDDFGLRGRKDYQSQNIPDPYASSTLQDDWFKTESHKDIQWPNKSIGQDFKVGPSSSKKQNKQRNVNFNRSDMQTTSLSYSFQSLDDSQVTWTETPDYSLEDKKTSINISPDDDSLVAILDDPTPSQLHDQTKTTPRWVAIQEKENRRKWANNTGTGIKCPGPQTATNNIQQATSDQQNIVSDNTYVVDEGKNVTINFRSYRKEPKTSKSKSLNTVAEVVDLFPKKNQTNVHGLGLDVEDMSLQSKETFDSSWKSFGNTNETSFVKTNDCAVFGRSNDCVFQTNNLFSIDMTKGFQATLSNYINAAMSDMKEGLSTLGKKWEENIGENPFLINSFELDSMMNILKGEMNTLSPTVNNMKSFAECGANDGACGK
jgi:curved DNA-binding protein CbpA